MSMKIEEIPSNMQSEFEKVELPKTEMKEPEPEPEIPQTLDDILPRTEDFGMQPYCEYEPKKMNKLFNIPQVSRDVNLIPTQAPENNMTKYLLGAGLLFTVVSGMF